MWGVDAYAVEVEVNASSDKVITVVVGLSDTAVKESCHRVITAVTIAVATGAFSVEQLSALNPTPTFKDLSDTQALLNVVV